jgi:hypothetical protein
MVLFFLLIIAAIVLGAVGYAVNGLFYLLIIGAVLFLADLVYLGTRLGRGRRRPTR